MQINFSKTAQQRLESLAAYIYEKSGSKKTTHTYLLKLKHYIIQTLTHFPHAGRACEEIAPKTRKLVYQGFSIIYNIQDETINILTIYRENLP